MDRDKLKALLIEDEGLRTKPYLDCCGKYWRDCTCETKGYLTIGIGRNLDTVGLSEQECHYLNDNDNAAAVSYCRQAFAWFNDIDDTRQVVIADMVFALGAKHFADFKKLISAMEGRDYETAANEILCSHWASQVGKRAVRLAQMMRDGDTIH